MLVVAQVEPAASTVESQPVEDPPTMKFTWTIENFARLNTKKHYSDMFIVGGYKWYFSLVNHLSKTDLSWLILHLSDSILNCFGLFGQADTNISQGKQCGLLVNVFGCGGFRDIAIWVE